MLVRTSISAIFFLSLNGDVISTFDLEFILIVLIFDVVQYLRRISAKSNAIDLNRCAKFRSIQAEL